jgi:glycosyltransferase involved in cell wall biosynthesis
MYDQIVPLILTFNEESNLARVLSKLNWAKVVVVIDSYSNDRTQAIAESFNNVSFHQRKFDCHANQWNMGLDTARRFGAWVLALDADYVLSDGVVDELKTLTPNDRIAGYVARFVYCIDGLPLRASLYPPHTVLFRIRSARYIQDGHTQRLVLEEPVLFLDHPIFHDDRKSWQRWYANQQQYADLEAKRIKECSWGELTLSRRIRYVPLVSILVSPIYLLFGKDLWRDGARGWKYIWQRLAAEWLIQRSLWMRPRR